MTPQELVDDLSVSIFQNLQRDPSLNFFRCESTLFDESTLFLLEPPTTVFATQNVTEDPPPVTVSFCLPITPAPIPVRLAAVAVASVLVDFDAADVELAQLQVLERPQIPTQDARISDSSSNSLPNENSQTFRIVTETPLGID